MEGVPAGHKICFPRYRRGRNGVEVFEGTILDHARRLGVEISAECGGRARAGSVS
jgi:uncharacterized 2Fe-2S/4Fe-4S cluster protein (DUF4445 family)